MEKKAATKGSMDNLIANAGKTNKLLYLSISQEIATINSCDDNIPGLLRIVPELKMDVGFILVDLQTSVRSCLETDKAYEKRYHLKNLYAGLVEGYKLLRGFGNMQSKTIWSRLGIELQRLVKEDENNKDLLLTLKANYEQITKKLHEFELELPAKSDRDLAFHYDDDLSLVYKLTLKTNSEDDAFRTYINFMDVLNAIMGLSHQVELVLSASGSTLPKCEGENDVLSLIIIHRLASLLGQHPKLPDVLTEAIELGANRIDALESYKRGVAKIKAGVSRYIKKDIEIPEFDIINELVDAALLVNFMMSDMATIMKAFMNCKSEAECPLILRRLTISRVSALSHFVGYGKKESDSMLSRIIRIVPDDNTDLKEEGIAIQKLLILCRRPQDRNTRALFIHLIDNRSYLSNIPKIIKKVENLDILAELDDSQLLVKICGRLSTFLMHVMTSLSEKAHNAKNESNKRLRDLINSARNNINDSNRSNAKKRELFSQMEQLERLIGNDNI